MLSGLCAWLRARIGGDRGSIMPLVIGFFAIAMSLVITVTNSSSLYLERKRLLAVTDAAVLSAAESFELYEGVKFSGSTLEQRLSESAAGERLRNYLIIGGSTEKLADLRLESWLVTGSSVRATVSSSWSPPLLGFIFGENQRVRVTGKARGHFE